MTSDPRVGFVGLGDQGEPMAHRILDAGFELHVFARRPTQAADLVARGAIADPSLPDLAADVDFVCVCVGNDADVDEVCDALLTSLAPGSSIAIHSTVHPDTCRAVAERAAVRGVSVIDAPVSGGRDRAREGELTVLVGGSDRDVERWRPVLDTFGGLIVHVGRLGSGQILKLVNNILFTAQLAVTADAFDLCEQLGLDVPQSAKAIGVSTGGSRCIQMYVDRQSDHVFPRHSDGRRRGAELLAKDIDLASSTVTAAGAHLPEQLARLVSDGLALAVESGRNEDP